MTRRELLGLTASSLLYASLSPLSRLSAAPATGGSRRLFFLPSDLPRIRANTRTPLLASMYAEWSAKQPRVLAKALDTFEDSGDIVRDFGAAAREFSHSAFVQLVEPSEARKASILAAMERFMGYPYWDYFRDGGTEVIGIQRASFLSVRLLFAREVLEGQLDPAFDKRLLGAIAEKGCLPCYRTVYDMDHPETVKGWDFDEDHAGFYDITMERWPIILGANNLRVVPTGALGLGALALQGHDPRAEEWLDRAVSSAIRFLGLVSPDGSYFEGLSYLGYCLRTFLPFMDAHRRLVGDVDWLSKANFNGMLHYTVTMQLGKAADGEPDIVNFSDANRSVFPGGLSLIGHYTGNPLGAWAAREAGSPHFIYDFLWYRPDAPAEPPRPELLNWRNDLDWIICRSGWEAGDSVVAFKSGPPANHEHADRHHIIFKSRGERLLNDHYGASYDRRQPGWTMRFTRGHNAILINGEGHPYIEGLEGTNESRAYAGVVSFHDHGERVWWTSDASSAYILNNEQVKQVYRTVLFAKPDVLIVIDQVRIRYLPQTVDARFFPDNADGQARLSIDGNRFLIERPGARLHGLVASDTGAAPRMARLEVPAEVGEFPCVEVHSPEALTHHLITVLRAADPDAEAPVLEARHSGDGWFLQAGDFEARVRLTTFQPQVQIL